MKVVLVCFLAACQAKFEVREDQVHLNIYKDIDVLYQTPSLSFSSDFLPWLETKESTLQGL
jgi:hypothetical protein